MDEFRRMFKTNKHLNNINQFSNFDKALKKRDIEKNTILMYVVRESTMEMFDLFVSKITEAPDEQNIYGETALHIAICRGNLHLIEELLKLKINVNLQNREGHTAVNYAIMYNDVLNLRCVLSQSAYFIDNIDSYIDQARKENKKEMVTLLVEYKKNFDWYNLPNAKLNEIAIKF